MFFFSCFHYLPVYFSLLHEAIHTFSDLPSCVHFSFPVLLLVKLEKKYLQLLVKVEGNISQSERSEDSDRRTWRRNDVII